MRAPGAAAIVWTALIALSTLLAAPVAADRSGFVIRSFDTQLAVEANSDVAVEERIEVEFSEPRHGLYRTIPVRYADGRGFARSLGLRLSSVTDESGRKYGTRVTDEGRYAKIRIGDPEREVRGRMVYVIRYRVRDALGCFPEHDEIYWNATGHEWNATIERATATVRLPAALRRDQLEAAGYTGVFGSRERAVAISYPEPGVVRFVATGPFPPLEGLTVAVGWPRGHVRFPTALERAGRLIADNWIILLPLGWLVFLWRRYRRVGRDPDPNAPVMVQYDPPPGLSPGAVGTLIDESVDLADITATAVDLAIRRHLTIHVEKRERLFGLIEHEETVFKREDPPTGDALAAHERQVMEGLFATGSEVDAADLTNRFYARIPSIRTALYDLLVERGYFDSSPEKVRVRYVLYGFVAGVATALVGAGWMALRGVGAPAAVLVPILSGTFTWLLFGAFAPAMPRRTESGARTRQWALGFQEYTRRVEEDRLERSATDPRAAFEKLLPYAMALGVAGEWAQRFDGIYTRTEPAWFTGSHTGRGFSTRAFERSLSGAMTRAGRTMSSAPRSSGSGGGGSSGGGGGGGGGGSW